MRLVSKCLASFVLFSGAAFADDLQYEGFWVPGEATSLHTAPLARQKFLDAGQQLAEAGFVLVDVETGRRDGQRLFASLWTRGTGATIFEGPLGPVQMREAMEARAAEGLRLVDFEIFRPEGGGRRYLAVWRPGSGGQTLTGRMEQDAFFARAEALTADGLRLRDVEIEEIDGTLFYSGLFRGGAGLNVLTRPMPLATFRAALPGQLEAGLELIDMERIGDSQRVVGVFRSGDGPAEVVAPRSFADYFILSQDQFNNDLRSRDFELFAVAGPTPRPDPVDLENPPAFPENAAHVTFSDGFILRLEFTQIDDQPFTLTLPHAALPDWLPRDAEGTPILPDAHCGLRIRRADSIFWQVPGDPAVTSGIFNAVEDVSDLGSELFLGGVHFAGPIGACTGTQKKWAFPSPFTSQTPFEPLPNMSLVVQLDSSSEIDFIKDTGPSPKPIDVDKLFKDDTKKMLKDHVKFWNALMKAGGDVSDYCTTVGPFWKRLCQQFPDGEGLCAQEVLELPGC
jgi:hypothetical protein